MLLIWTKKQQAREDSIKPRNRVAATLVYIAYVLTPSQW